ncbi:DNA-binding transcriptional regulator, FadR family [Devosia lucknowensis]|uniref:DNA-binding transcriptional regulator, FadR family n=1 Tax=Devosia lucknowensis TaxID=1096929 RepID=A0A1Y6GC18_9HYPH|nr:FadR/GntR family transcriptional regulator [Devosia lucknowensis]SMQ85320.1 DNA-binding transcriptional regulator, FadR family [Devosia lucknowensis]
MKLQAVSNRKLYIQIADQIRDQIHAGAVEPGRQLPSERDLAQNLGVSRPTVREALIALEVAGLVEVRVGVGAFVRKPDTPDDGLPEQSASPLEIMAVRRLLEPEVAALATQSISPEGTARLGEAIRWMRTESQAGNWSSESDRMLHMTLADACGNAVLRDMLDGLWNSRRDKVDTRFHQHLADIGDVRAHILADHEAIVGAVVSGNAEGARTAMARHLQYVADAMLDAWE